MTCSISRKCSQCKNYIRVPLQEDKFLVCPNCSLPWGNVQKEEVFEKCPICECRHFYRHRDFNQALGCAILVVGIILVPVTYGLSLPILALADWWFYRKTKDVALCYRCGTEFRGFEIPKWIHTFEHHLGDKYQEKGL